MYIQNQFYFRAGGICLLLTALTKLFSNTQKCNIKNTYPNIILFQYDIFLIKLFDIWGEGGIEYADKRSKRREGVGQMVTLVDKGEWGVGEMQTLADKGG